MHGALVPNELLVPPRRLGQLLAQTRLELGYTLEEAAEALGEHWSALDLLEIETGHRPPLDRDLAAITGLYGIQTGTLIPDRSQLVLDLEEGVLAVGPRSVSLSSDQIARRDLLSNYLSLVYMMRDVRPGTAVPLRYPDLETLSHVTECSKREVEDELRRLMVESVHLLERKKRRLRKRILIPTVGVVVAVTTAGTLLLTGERSGASSATPAGPGSSKRDLGAPTEIGTAIIQDRLPDGTPGPVHLRD